MMRVAEVAKVIAESFNEDIKMADCETFKEMRMLYDWDAKDIKAEIEYRTTKYLNECYDNGIDTKLAIMDDCSMISFVDSHEDCTYGAYKKMIMERVA